MRITLYEVMHYGPGSISFSRLRITESEWPILDVRALMEAIAEQPKGITTNDDCNSLAIPDWNFMQTKSKLTFHLHHTLSLRPWVTLLGKRMPTFQVCGYTGLALGFVQSMMLVRHLHLSPLTLLGITGVVIVTFFSLTMVTKILAGEEVIIYYHHEIAVVVMTALFLRLVRQPVLPYLDITILGIGLFLACGRVGCLMVGCCHGRPWNWGVTYCDAHAEAGFPAYLVGVKLFPIQAVESVFALCLVACGIVLLLKGYPPGTALLFYVVLYGLGRFCFELARGDTKRPYLLGFSEAQWTSLLLALALIAAGRMRILPVSRWHWTGAFAMGVSMVLIAIWRRLDHGHTFKLLHPRHVQEIIGTLDHLQHLQGQVAPSPEVSRYPLLIPIVHTSLGYRISAGQSVMGSRTLRHYSISKDGEDLSLTTAQILSQLIARVEARPNPPKLVPGNMGVFHVLFDVSGDAPDALGNQPGTGDSLSGERHLQ